MSGIYIPGMEMPTSCFKCEFRTKIDPDNLLCSISQKTFEDRFYHIEHRDQSCPLVPVPPHGDLIDRDDFFATCPELVDGYKRITDDLVVIPAEEGEG